MRKNVKYVSTISVAAGKLIWPITRCSSPFRLFAHPKATFVHSSDRNHLTLFAFVYFYSFFFNYYYSINGVCMDAFYCVYWINLFGLHALLRMLVRSLVILFHRWPPAPLLPRFLRPFPASPPSRNKCRSFALALAAWPLFCSMPARNLCVCMFVCYSCVLHPMQRDYILFIRLVTFQLM